jgi:hypothetical protein
MIKERFLHGYATLQSMPMVLRWITVFCFIGGLFFIIGLFLPFTTFIVNKREVSMRAYWASGAGVAVLILSLSMVGSGLAIISKKTWSRVMLIMIMPIQSAIYIIFRPDDLYNLLQSLLVAGVFAVALWLYLFWTSGVKDYFQTLKTKR